MNPSSASANPVALVTGASRGIGRAIAERLAADGFHVVVNYLRSEEAAGQLAESLTDSAGIESIAMRGDIARLDDHAGLIDSAIQRWGRLDVLVNNAGVGPTTRLDLLEATPESWDRVLATNLRGPYFLAQSAARSMLNLISASVIPRGALINISSISSYTASVQRGEYCVAKAGMAMMTHLFAARLAAENILVYEVSPGIVSTDMTAGVRDRYDQLIDNGLLPIARWGEPQDVAAAVSVLARGELSYCTGQTLHVDGGFHIRRL